jgi:hypothetical protein
MIGKIWNNLSLVERILVIAAIIVSIGTIIAIIVFAFREWKWLVGIGVPAIAASILMFFAITKIKTAYSK